MPCGGVRNETQSSSKPHVKVISVELVQSRSTVSVNVVKLVKPDLIQFECSVNRPCSGLHYNI